MTTLRSKVNDIMGISPNSIDPVQATLEASLKAVGAAPTTAPSLTPIQGDSTIQKPCWRAIALGVSLLSIGVLYLSLFTGHPPTVSRAAPTITIAPTLLPTSLPTTTPVPNPQEVTLPVIALYGDYDESTLIGSAPSSLVCAITGQSPDGGWVHLSCPAPTNTVWAKVGDVKLSASQWDTLRTSRIVRRAVPTVPALSSPPVQAAPAVYCADRVSVHGSTRQCASTQAEADALADSAIGIINGVTPTTEPTMEAFRESFQEPPDCNPFIGYVGEKRTQCQGVYATQTAEAK
jgi:hypothetical protein